MLRFLICIFFCTLASSVIVAQDDLPTPQRVEVAAADSLMMVGDFYQVASITGHAPTVVLLHGRGGDRHDMDSLVLPLLNGGYNVLLVDQRGYGETGGIHDLLKIIDDLQFWLDWLKQQPTAEDDAIAIFGMSMGAVPALVGCAREHACHTVIALSPGDFPLLDEAMFQAMSDRSILIIAGRQDLAYYDARELAERAAGELMLHTFETAGHANYLYDARYPYREATLTLVMDWLEDHMPSTATMQ